MTDWIGVIGNGQHIGKSATSFSFYSSIHGNLTIRGDLKVLREAW